MPATSNRRAFLSGAFRRNPQVPLRPFGAGTEAAFQRDCTSCGDCLSACPPGIIVMDKGELPVIAPARGGCTFCGDCITACPTDALDASHDWPWRARVKDDCLSMNAITCRTCQDVCEHDAIRFRPAIGGRSIPSVDLELCNGCGNCVGFCPSSSLELTRSHERTAP